MRIRSAQRRHPTARPSIPTPVAAAVGAAFAGILISSDVRAEDTPTTLGTVVVTATAEPGHAEFLSSRPDTSATTYQVGPDGLETFGAPGGTNPYTMVSGLPAVKVQALDPYGLTSRIGGNKGMRVRGIAAWHGAVGTVDGLTLSNINPGPGYLQMFDRENLAGVSMAQGPVAPDQPALFNTAGALDSQILWPALKAGGSLSAASGDNGFERYFARVDSGAFGPANTRIAASASTAHANLWRGPGQAERENYLLAVATDLGPLTLKLLAVNSNIDQNNYKPLTAAQALDLSTYRYTGYDARPAAGNLQNYYTYNRQSFDNQAYIGEAEYRVSNDTRARLKLFSFDESGATFDANGTNKVRQWIIEHNSFGASADVETRIDATRLKAGYSYTSMQPPGPPNAQRFYTATANGLSWAAATASSSNQGWTTLSEVTGRHVFQTLFAMASWQYRELQLEGGLRWFQEKMPSLAEYTKTGVGDVSYRAALAASPGVAVAVDGQTVAKVLPWFGLRYAFTPAVEGRFSAGRNIGPASFDIWNSNIRNLKASQQALAQSLWNKLKPETDDAADLGLRLRLAQGYVEPTVYYASINNKSVNVYDPTVGLNYGQNIGNGHLAGVQLAAGWEARPNLNLFGSASWSRAVFDENLRTAASTVVAVKGQQLPDTPRLIGTLGAEWKAGDFRAVPLLRYMGGRYDDSVHTNRFGGYTLVDLELGYRWQVGPTRVDASLSALNLFDRKYLGLIDSGDLQTSTTNYYPGNPRTLLGKLALSF
ncbi:TonB-dependent receptor [Zoogloea sp. LCSB751]|uniref:TonB-dependent receptor n=1 Tax=Zoogloea sp. LCSB751 TaxID=1965277 RepID=UPI0009A47588|nr:TonB-dependent receptor [Zoogloea sp. LCSB751]